MGSTRFMNINTFMNDQDDSENSAENSADSPRYALLNDTKMTSSTSNSPKKSRRSAQKRVISVPIKDVEGSRLKGEMGAPPSDSWAWRKYGQKPIKGSPYPRGYYRCSSSKGCPARKQVERSRIDPTMLMVTYTCEHNHPWPPSRNTNNHHNAAAIASTKKYPTSQTEPTNSGELQEQEDHQEEQKKPTINITTTTTTSQTDINMDHDQKLAATLSEYAGCNNNCWFSDFESMLESPPLMMNDEARVTDADMAMFFTMRDEDESFFADLGELPECSTVFRRGMMEREEEERRRHNLAPWCGTTG